MLPIRLICRLLLTAQVLADRGEIFGIKYLKSLLHKLKHLVLAAMTTFLLLFPVAVIPRISDTEKITENHPKIGNTINKITEKVHENVSEVRKDEQK